MTHFLNTILLMIFGNEIRSYCLFLILILASSDGSLNHGRTKPGTGDRGDGHLKKEINDGKLDLKIYDFISFIDYKLAEIIKSPKYKIFLF